MMYLFTSAYQPYKINNMKTITKKTNKKESSILKIAKYLKANKEASVYDLQRKCFKNNPADSIMALRRTYGWVINCIRLEANRFVYRVKKAGKMPSA